MELIEQAEKKIKMKLKDDMLIDFNQDMEEDEDTIFNSSLGTHAIEKNLNQGIMHLNLLPIDTHFHYTQ